MNRYGGIAYTRQPPSRGASSRSPLAWREMFSGAKPLSPSAWKPPSPSAWKPPSVSGCLKSEPKRQLVFLALAAEMSVA